MSSPAIAWAFAKRHIGSKAVETVLIKAVERAAITAVTGAFQRGTAYIVRLPDDRKHRRLANDLAGPLSRDP